MDSNARSRTTGEIDQQPDDAVVRCIPTPFRLDMGPSVPQHSTQNVNTQLLTDAMYDTNQPGKIIRERDRSVVVHRHLLFWLEEIYRVEVAQVHSSLVRRRGLMPVLV